MAKKSERTLSKSELLKKIFKRIGKYKKFNFFEKYAMFMGKVQILEFGLKKLLEEKFEYDLEKIGKWTLGHTIRELEKENLRGDFMILLKEVLELRNYITHELLLNKSLIGSIIKNKKNNNCYNKEHRALDKAIIELEQLIFLFDWANKNEAWVEK